jgi:hypothetical protein
MEGFTGNELRQVFLDWAARNSQQWSAPAVLGITGALREAWPCKAAAALSATAPSEAPKWQVLTSLSDSEIAKIIVEQSISKYHATGHPCACPFDVASNGSRCGARSAYSRPGGSAPLCYVSDVTKTQIEAYRAAQR